MDIHSKIKKDVLASLIEEMDGKIISGLKEKSPKFMKVETNDPEMARKIASVGKEEMADIENLKELKEMSGNDGHEKFMMNSKEDVIKSHEDKMIHPEEEDEDLERLKELYELLK